MFAEQFITFFDSRFLPYGLSLYSSLEKHSEAFTLWVVCMDDLVYKQLELIGLRNARLIELSEIEDQRLLSVKKERTWKEYCWTITPFVCEAVFKRDATVERITYLDADLFFFRSPKAFFAEFEESGKGVLITEHAFDPVYEQSERTGRFCVQYLTFNKTEEAIEVLRWWQDRVIEWCFCRMEDGKFGDQKYLDSFPELFPEAVHVLTQRDKTLAPWNVRYYEKKGTLDPVFYHFHQFRIVEKNKAAVCSKYRILKGGMKLYEAYAACIREQRRLIETAGFEFPVIPEEKLSFAWIRKIKRYFFALIKGLRFGYLYVPKRYMEL
jgi:hypothetical protein